MKTSTIADLYTGLTVTLLLILTAWGNAIAMCIVAVLGVVGGLLIFGRSFARRGAVAATVGFLVAVAIVEILLPH